MPRRIIYGISLWLFLSSAALTITSIALPTWVVYTSPTAHDSTPIRVTYGLHSRCSSITNTCTPFPPPEECHGEERGFCSAWRTSAFLMNFSVVLMLACLVAYVTVLVGGRQVREKGWKVLVGLLAVVAGSQLTAMALVAALYEKDKRFFVGWELGTAWILCTISWITLLVDALGIMAGAYFYPQNVDYEPIPDPQ
ncbi:unnamed protein product [Zymoseptoria tritici ST99CH_3D7]|uniref:MARVEL domain-containing protein n=1 Tax=Zymoseptoria tritici (strain ST99CH_3D7) TaxID=1276538 RepID=A0A1X7REB5_ZYMT9|nr:unnamed protein product [Zymoseptoria tritici ST99CH_3D7]